MQLHSLCVCLVILPIGVKCQGDGCVSPVSLLEGSRRIVGATLRASDARDDFPASEARLNDDGWCSDQQGTNIFDPFIEADFSRNVLFNSIATQGVCTNLLGICLAPFILHTVERYRVEVAGEDGNLQYVIQPSNVSQPGPAIFPLQQGRITDSGRHVERLPIPVIGQRLRVLPYRWNDNDYSCTKLEVYGCPLQECQSESRLHMNPGVEDVTVSDEPINRDESDDLFGFDGADRYCAPSSTKPFTITIPFSSLILLTEIHIRGNDRAFFTDQYVSSFSVSFSDDDVDFTEYVGSTAFTVSDANRHFFGLWPPITATSIEITINDWESSPCMSLLLLGCNYSNVIDHNETASPTNPVLLEDVTVTLTTTVTQNVTTFITKTASAITIFRTVVADLSTVLSLSPTQGIGAAGSASCTSNDDNTPIYVAVAIVIVGLLIAVAILIVGIVVCRRYRQQEGQEQPDISKSQLAVKYNTANSNELTSMVEIDNDLYGRQDLTTPKESSPASGDIQILYDVNKQPGIVETADNPQYGDIKSSDHASDNVYSYAVL